MSGLLAGLAAILVGGLLLWTCWLGSQRRLPRNRIVGIRLPSTLRSDEAWTTAHVAAAVPFGLGGGIVCTCGIGILVNGLDLIGIGLGVIALVALLGSTGWATVVALRAVRDLPS